MDLKILKPSMRDKKRYLFLEGKFTKKEVEGAILKYIGVLGFAKASPMWISDKILAVNRKEIDKIRASLVFLDGLKIAKVSGTLKKLRG